MTVTTFSELELDESLLEALQDKGFTRPTAIQAAAIPPALDGRDVAGGFYHADHAAIPLLGRTDLADITCGEVLTDTAAVQILFGMFNGLGQFHGLFVRHAHDLVGHAGGAFAADAGKPVKLIHQIFQRL